MKKALLLLSLTFFAVESVQKLKLPKGDYKKSCKKCTYTTEDYVLRCQCRYGKNQYKSTSISLDDNITAENGLSNYDGILGPSKNIIKGAYLEDCENCYITSCNNCHNAFFKLNCKCKNGKNSYKNASVELPDLTYMVKYKNGKLIAPENYFQ